jgi:hypothetical protein
MKIKYWKETIDYFRALTPEQYVELLNKIDGPLTETECAAQSEIERGEIIQLLCDIKERIDTDGGFDSNDTSTYTKMGNTIAALKKGRITSGCSSTLPPRTAPCNQWKDVSCCPGGNSLECGENPCIIHLDNYTNNF